MIDPVSVLVLIYIELGVYFTYKFTMLFWKNKKRLIIIELINAMIFISPYVLYKYEVWEAINRNATGWDAAPFAWFGLLLLLTSVYIGSTIILLVINAIRKKKEVSKNKYKEKTN